jgi:hypothetical protein
MSIDLNVYPELVKKRTNLTFIYGKPMILYDMKLGYFLPATGGDAAGRK